MHPLAKLDHRYIWHPFTQMRDWLEVEPILIRTGNGACVRDLHGKTYLDANSSIWTNLHGHRHPAINRAIERQLRKIAHSSFLGLANEPASLLAEKLVNAASFGASTTRARRNPGASPLEKVFFSDDGSTAIEVALKLAYQYRKRARPGPEPRFLALEGAYHGDTIGAVSLGHIDLFHKSYAGLLFRTDTTPAPYCYRCRFNRAKPEPADARSYRRCHWECLDLLEQKFARQKRKGNPYAGFIFEPLIQGAAGMIPQPVGWLRRATEIGRAHGALLIADEVLTGFGRTGCTTPGRDNSQPGSLTTAEAHKLPWPKAAAASSFPLFACQHEDVRPDLLALAKGLTGGYLPMAATLSTQAIFDAFLGKYSEFRTFFHGHSYTGNQLGAAAALASLKLLLEAEKVRHRRALERSMAAELQQLWASPKVGDIRQVGLIAAIELVSDPKSRRPFPLAEQAGARVCQAMARNGVLTRPIGNVVVLMPPYCTTLSQLARMIDTLARAVSSARL